MRSLVPDSPLFVLTLWCTLGLVACDRNEASPPSEPSKPQASETPSKKASGEAAAGKATTPEPEPGPSEPEPSAADPSAEPPPVAPIPDSVDLDALVDDPSAELPGTLVHRAQISTTFEAPEDDSGLLTEALTLHEVEGRWVGRVVYDSTDASVPGWSATFVTEPNARLVGLVWRSRSPLPENPFDDPPDDPSPIRRIEVERQGSELWITTTPAKGSAVEARIPAPAAWTLAEGEALRILPVLGEARSPEATPLAWTEIVPPRSAAEAAAPQTASVKFEAREMGSAPLIGGPVPARRYEEVTAPASRPAGALWVADGLVLHRTTPEARDPSAGDSPERKPRTTEYQPLRGDPLYPGKPSKTKPTAE